ncbi:MAG: prepilin peptidase [Acidobacteria bacterium]|nr:prepilin peptidase [Acidobacteriota bacterium]
MTLLLIYCGVLGLAIGSFLNVVIYRVPRHLSIVRPGSACPVCSRPIAARDNIPVISWIVLGGRCRGCHSPISMRYPLVELTTAGLFAVTAWRVGAHLDLVAFLILDAALLALALIDVEMLLLPRSIVYPTLVAVGTVFLATAALQHQWHRLLVAALCSLAWFTVFFVMNLISPRSLGFGDVRLSAVLGLALGWWGVGEVILGFFLSNLVGAVVGVTLIATQKMRRDQPVPYGVFLAIGTVLTVLVGPLLLSHWHHWPST